MPEPVFLLLGEFVVRLEDREVVWLCTSDEFLEPHAHLLSTPAYHASIVEAHGSVRDDELLVDAYHASESLAGRAGTNGELKANMLSVGSSKVMPSASNRVEKS